MAAVMGWQAAEMIGRPFANFLHPDDLHAPWKVWNSYAVANQC